MSSFVEPSRTQAIALASMPVLAAAVVWLREAAWFKSFQLTEALLIVAFVGGAGVVALVVSSLVFWRLRSLPALLVAGLCLGAVALLAAREAASTAMAAGFSSELGAYTSLLSLVASRRSLLFILCVASVPLLLAAFCVLNNARKPSARVATLALGLCVLAANAYVAAT